MSENGNNDFGQTSPGGGGSLRLDQQGSMPVAGQELRRHLRRAGMVTDLSGLSDIDFDSAEPADGQGLAYSAANENWRPRDLSVSSPILTGTNSSSSATSIELKAGADVTIEPGNIGVPVATSMTATSVAVSWIMGASGDPPSTWTLKLHKRTGEGTLNEVATFTVNTQ